MFLVREARGLLRMRASAMGTLVYRDGRRETDMWFIHTDRPLSWHRRGPRLAGFGGLYNSNDIRLMIFTAEGESVRGYSAFATRGIILHHLSRGVRFLYMMWTARPGTGEARATGNGMVNRSNGTNTFLSTCTSESVGARGIVCCDLMARTYSLGTARLKTHE